MAKTGKTEKKHPESRFRGDVPDQQMDYRERIKIIFWGSRGSLPASVTAQKVRSKVIRSLKMAKGRNFANLEEIETFVDNELPFSLRGCYGCNTSCVEIQGGEDHVILDSGTGIRNFGNHMVQNWGITGHRFHIFMSHLHWDHIQGFPFFTPAFFEGNQIDIYGFHTNLEETFIRQQAPPCFPVPLSRMKADIRFHTLVPGEPYNIAGFEIFGQEQNHPGKSYGISFQKHKKRIVYSTDSEHKRDSHEQDYPLLHLYKNADLLIFDTQYPLRDALGFKESWGHSSNMIGVELAVRAGVGHLCMFHNEHSDDDDTLEKFFLDAVKYAKIYEKDYPLTITMAYDGMEILV